MPAATRAPRLPPLPEPALLRSVTTGICLEIQEGIQRYILNREWTRMIKPMPSDRFFFLFLYLRSFAVGLPDRETGFQEPYQSKRMPPLISQVSMPSPKAVCQEPLM